MGSAVLLDHVFPPDLRRSQKFALLLEAENGTVIDGHTSQDGFWRLPLDHRTVDPVYLDLLMKTEDRRFNRHPGVDPGALGRAFWQLLRRGHIVSGGSTLTMQVARLLTPHPHTISGKLRDILRALQLEWHYGRSGVLNLYLVLAPEGRNVEGIRAASLLYFHHEPTHLTHEEAAFLVAIPRRPSAFRPDCHLTVLQQAAARILTRADFSTVGVEETRFYHVFPHDAPSLTSYLLSSGRRGMIHSTLNSVLQRSSRRFFAEQIPPSRGTFAALVVDRQGRIVVWIGGAEHQCPGCAMDGVRALRSPGSTLKPFVYGMAFERNLLLPETTLDDTRLSFGGYAPRDYDHAFRGKTTVARALQLSLNVPAVEVLSKIGPDHFTSRLAENGVSLHVLHGKQTPNLSIILGGADLSLFDLTRLYTAIDHDGLIISPYFEKSQQAKIAPTRLLNSGATKDIRTVLHGTRPPKGGENWRNVAFKTGTSYGGRDAWAMASTHSWTIGVWAGRPDGTPSPGMTGRAQAGPVLAGLLARLPDAARTGNDQAEHMRHHRPVAQLSPALISAARVSAPQIIVPRANAVIESRSMDGTMLPVGLEADGGRAPYHWFANGVPLDLLPGADPSWTPAESGFAHLTVVDALGRYSAITIQVK